MPKRTQDEDSDEYIRRKMRKIEKKLRRRKKRSRRISSDSSNSRMENASPVLSLPEDSHEAPLVDSIAQNEQLGPPTQDVDVEIIPGPSTPAPADAEECPLDDEILELLGASPTKNKKLGDNIQKDIALRWEHIATSGLTKETRKELLERHLLPGNCIKLSAPVLNPEIKAAMSDIMIGKDKATENKQNQVTSVLSCIGEALTKMFNSEHKDALVIKPLLEGAQLLCDIQFSDSMKRRSLICASIKKEIKNQLYETEIDTHLFGEKLADTLKAAKAISKSGSEIKATKPKTPGASVQSRNLNSRPQLANSRQPVKRRQDPAVYQQTPTVLPPRIPQRRYYQTTAPIAPPPLPLPRLPPPPPPQQLQPYRPRPYQRR